MGERDSKLRTIVSNIIIGSISILILILVAEVVSRFFFRADLPHMVDMNGNYQTFFEPDDELGKIPKKNFRGNLIAAEFNTLIYTNSDGFRSDFEYTAEGDSIIKIMLLGDSFTFGFGVERAEAFDFLLKKMIEDSLGLNVECYNYGVIGYGTLQELIVYHKHKNIKPDLLIIGFYARDMFGSPGGNDIVDNYKFAISHNYNNSELDSKSFESSSTGSSLRKIRFFLKNNSNLYRVLELRLGGIMRKYYSPKDNLHLKEQAWNSI